MDKKIIKEWNKIKDYQILNNISDLENLYKACPNGKCMRKYTAYPWSKENFFFGTAQDLLNWYKTTDEIPFYTKNYINSIYGNLQIINFKRDLSNNNMLLAICKCNCGNIAEFEFSKIRHGDIVSCGCKRKTKKFLSVYDVYTDIVNKFWDYKKNKIHPTEILYNSNDYFWWKGYNESYLMSPSSLSIKQAGTSFPEQAILFYLKKFFNNVQSRFKLPCDNKKYELDIFLSDINIAIEYDGYVWHKNKQIEDINKSEQIINNGIYLIRVRESGLLDFQLNNMKIIRCDIDNLNYFEALSEVIYKIKNLIITKCKNKQFENFEINADIIKKDKFEIESQYLTGYQKDNIANNFLSIHWNDSEQLDKYKISANSYDKFKFKCNANNNIYISPKSITNIYNKIEDKKEKIEFEKNLLLNNDCPFKYSKECPCNALYHENNLKPCKYFKEFESLRLEKSIAINESICSMVGIKTTSFKDFKATYNKFLKKIPKTFEIQILKELVFYFQNSLFYHVKDIVSIFEDFINSKLNNNLKFEYIEKILSYPYMTREDIAKCFSFKILRDFYFRNVNYNNIFKSNENLLLNIFHEIPIIDILKNLIYQHKVLELKEILNIIHEKISQKQYDLFLKSLSVCVAIKSTHKYKELIQTAKIYNETINVLTDKTTDFIKNEIVEILKTPQTDIRKKYIFQFIEDCLNTNELTREILINLYSRFDDDKPYFFDKLNEYITHDNEIIKNLLSKEIVFYKEIYKSPKIKSFDFEYKFDNEIVQNISSNNEITDIEKYKLITSYINNFQQSYYTIDVSMIKNPNIILSLLEKYGFSNVVYDVSIFNDCMSCDLLFNFIENLYDKKYQNTDYLVSTDKMLETFSNAIKNNVMNQYFLTRCKKTIKYIQERYKRKTNSYIYVYEIGEFNQLIGIKKK